MEKIISWFLALQRSTKRLLLVAVDFAVILLVLWMSFSIRLDIFYWPPLQQLWIFLAAPLVAIPIFIRFGLYHAIVRYVGFNALWAIAKAVVLYAFIWSSLLLIDQVDGVPRSVYILNVLLAGFFISGNRLIARWVFSGHRPIRPVIAVNIAKNVLIYGAGSAGRQLAHALSLSRELKPVAFIDDENALHGMNVHGLRVYPFFSLAQLIVSKQVSEVLLALPSATRSRRNQIISLLEPFAVHVRSIPGVAHLAQGKINADDIQEIDIAGLLGRGLVEPNKQLLNANIKQKTVLVTGAGGSIGSELCRQIVALEPCRLILFEWGEFQLYAIERELRKSGVECDIHPILGSVVDKKRLTDVCQTFGVQTIYHAAAYKHVPLVESNPSEGLRNNIMGTLNAALAAIDAKVETFVLISTDKAVRPTNTMGATKRFAELILQALNDDKISVNTRFTMVRFGNVLGSSGSVVPLFREQIAQGGPVTVTDKNIIRYFMTIPEAAELVIQAGAMGLGGDVFVLDMGDPVHIVDLAKKMIRLSGYTVKDEDSSGGEIEIVYTGLRPGEKLYEELLIGDNVQATAHDKIMRAQENVIAWRDLQQLIMQLEAACDKGDFQLMRDVFFTAVSGYSPQCDVVDELTLVHAEKSKPFNVVNIV
jgi:FlaA1/EpsC-like NDP-sugar epimerase